LRCKVILKIKIDNFSQNEQYNSKIVSMYEARKILSEDRGVILTLKGEKLAESLLSELL